MISRCLEVLFVWFWFCFVSFEVSKGILSYFLIPIARFKQLDWKLSGEVGRKDITKLALFQAFHHQGHAWSVHLVSCCYVMKKRKTRTVATGTTVLAITQFLWARHGASIHARASQTKDWLQKKSFHHTLLSFHSRSVSKEPSLLPVLRFLASHMETESQRHVCVYAYRRMLVFQTQEKEKKKKTSPDFSIPVRIVVYYFWIWIIEFPGLLNIAKSHLQWIGLAPLIESCCEALYCFPHFIAEYFFQEW